MAFVDYALIVVYLAVVLVIGGVIGKKNETDTDYFSGGRSMPWYAIGVSVGATFLSANSFIGGPGWTYTDGIMSAMINFGVPLGLLFATYTILPIVYHNKVTTCYEYFNMRFGTKTRFANIIIWLVQNLCFLGAVIYTPALVLSAFTGISLNVWVPIIVVFAIIYTIAGGIKAVIWTDLIQGIILCLGAVSCLILAVKNNDLSFMEIMHVGSEAGLLKSFDFSWDLGICTFWCALIGTTFQWSQYFGFDQVAMQRFITAKDFKTIKRSSVMGAVSVQTIYWTCCIVGVFLFVFYQSHEHTLDFANVNNVMVDFLLNYLPTGLRGFILAAIFAAAMSTVDSILNSLTTVFVKDIYEPYITKKSSTSMKQNIMVSCVAGVIVVIFVYMYLSDSMASILQSVMDIIAPFCGLTAASMICALFIPKVNDNGMFLSCLVTGVVMKLWGMIYTPFYIWVTLFSGVIGAVLAYVFSVTIFRKSKLPEKAYSCTYYGAKKELAEVVEADGTRVNLMKFDKYAYYILAVFVVQCILLAVLQWGF